MGVPESRFLFPFLTLAIYIDGCIISGFIIWKCIPWDLTFLGYVFCAWIFTWDTAEEGSWGPSSAHAVSRSPLIVDKFKSKSRLNYVRSEGLDFRIR